jgi:opacity protein-like surface antigen
MRPGSPAPSGLFLSGALLAAAAMLPATAGAQGIALELDAGYADLTSASRSAQAVFGSSGGFTWGGALRYDVTESVYLSAGARVFDKQGERVFVVDEQSQVFPLGHPLSVRLVPLRLSLGYRFNRWTSAVPYLGVGGGIVSFREESTVGGVTEKTSESKGSFHVLGGLEYRRGSLGIGAELSYSWVPNAIGIGGVSAIYQETDIGGFQAVAKLTIRHAF